MRLHARFCIPIVLALAAPAAAQVPLEPYRPAERYSTFQIVPQVTGGAYDGRDILVAGGVMWAPTRQAMLRAEATGGVTTGAEVLDRVLAGPQLTLAYAFPGQYTSFTRDSRAEPYVLLTATGYGIVDFGRRGEGTDAGFSPALSAGVGFRVFGDEWDVELSTLELVMERRFGFRPGTEIFVRFGRATPRDAARAPREERPRRRAAPSPARARAPPVSVDPALVRASKFLSLVLRHRPDAAGIALDENGWTDADALVEACNRAGVPLDRALLERVVAGNDKRRFAFSPDGRRIRARQGHSVEVDLALEPTAPPETLFHGTASRFVDSIRAEGLLRRGRTHVHLSPDERTATSVGARHGKPVVLRVAAARMHADGFAFFLSENGVWLTEAVPPRYITFPEG